MIILQYLDPHWQAEICVTPLVDLIRNRYKNRAQEQVCTEWIFFLYFGIGRFVENPRQFKKYRNTDHKVISVRFYPIVTGYACWINVVLSEWTEEIFTNNWQVYGAPRICFRNILNNLN